MLFFDKIIFKYKIKKAVSEYLFLTKTKDENGFLYFSICIPFYNFSLYDIYIDDFKKFIKEKINFYFENYLVMLVFLNNAVWIQMKYKK